MKNNRLSVILDIINEMNIETQEELAAELKRRGLEVTQATVSRDIKELKLTKVVSDLGGYKYASAQKEETPHLRRKMKLFKESVVSVRSANNLIVIKTYAGTANAAASVIDSMNNPHILGSVAGDDTIMVVVEDAEHVAQIEAMFRNMIV